MYVFYLTFLSHLITALLPLEIIQYLLNNFYMTGFIREGSVWASV